MVPSSTFRDFKINISDFIDPVTIDNNKVYDNDVGPLPISIISTGLENDNILIENAGIKATSGENYNQEKQLYFNFQLANFISDSNYYHTLIIKDLKILINSNNISALQASANNIYQSN
jgi:hypothetical protein